MIVPAELSVPALFVAGIAASPHCSLMCGAVQALPLRARGTLPLGAALGWLHAGRVAGYATLGAIAGATGARIVGWLPEPHLGQAVQLLAAFLLILAGFSQWAGRKSGAGCTAHPRWSPGAAWPVPLRIFLQGLAWALLPCGLLYAMLFLAATTTSALTGALLLAAFGLGTAPLGGVAGSLVAGSRKPARAAVRRLAAALMILSGVGGAAMVLAQDGTLAAWCAPLYG